MPVVATGSNRVTFQTLKVRKKTAAKQDYLFRREADKLNIRQSGYIGVYSLYIIVIFYLID